MDRAATGEEGGRQRGGPDRQMDWASETVRRHVPRNRKPREELHCAEGSSCGCQQNAAYVQGGDTGSTEAASPANANTAIMIRGLPDECPSTIGVESMMRTGNVRKPMTANPTRMNCTEAR